MGDNTRFCIMVHWNDNFFIMEELDIRNFCYMDLLSQVHRGLRLDCEKKLQMEGQLPGDQRTLVDNDGALLKWFKENEDEGTDLLHLYVEELNHTVEPFLEEPNVLLSCPNTGYNGNSGSDDESYKTSDETSTVDVSYSDIDDFLVSENNAVSDDILEYDSENLGDDIHGSDSSESKPYLDRAYVGEIYKEPSKAKQLKLERGMLFANVDAFREVLKDYVVQEGFEIVRVRNERTRITTMCAGHGCEWYLHASSKPDEVTFEIKVYDGQHSCVKMCTDTNVTST